ncbi:hypothetical protein PBRA_007332 [Plasmodiophora brassicae]|nr:hypothetical protein PBRA_007332 [Plasmodiophora brassicae]
MALKKTKSHRQTLKVKHMVDKKAKAHRKRVAKLAKQNPLLAKRRSKDPGIPNLWPFKEDLCRQMLQKKQEADDRETLLREQRRVEKERRRAMIEKATAHAQSSFAEHTAKDANVDDHTAPSSSSNHFYKELRQVAEAADVILIVLDARDPLGCRNIDLEERILSGEMTSSSPIPKRIVLVLNKIDLVPHDVAQGWLDYLRRSRPTVPFSTTEVVTSGGADKLVQLLKNYSRSHGMKTALTVGLIGYPNTGKSSIVNALKRTRAVATGPTPGVTRHLQTVQLDGKISLIDSPGVIFNDDGANALRNALRVETIDDAVGAIASVVDKFPAEQLMQIYGIGRFSNASELLFRIAHKCGKLKKGGVPDLDQAARIVLRDWNTGKIPYYVPAPVDEQSTQVNDVQIVSDWAQPLDIDAIGAGDMALDNEEEQAIGDENEEPEQVSRPTTRAMKKKAKKEARRRKKILPATGVAMKDTSDSEEDFDFNQ